MKYALVVLLLFDSGYRDIAAVYFDTEEQCERAEVNFVEKLKTYKHGALDIVVHWSAACVVVHSVESKT